MKCNGLRNVASRLVEAMPVYARFIVFTFSRLENWVNVLRLSPPATDTWWRGHQGQAPSPCRSRPVSLPDAGCGPEVHGPHGSDGFWHVPVFSPRGVRGRQLRILGVTWAGVNRLVVHRFSRFHRFMPFFTFSLKKNFPAKKRG